MSNDEQVRSQAMTHSQILALRGLRLPAATLKSLQATGIYCQPSVSVEHQHLAGRYVLRGAESGGAVADLGGYCSFADDEGQMLSSLQGVDSIAVNGVHAIVVAPVLVRVHMVRVRHTYDLLITKHQLTAVEGARRPALHNSILFYGRRGTLEMDLCGKTPVTSVWFVLCSLVAAESRRRFPLRLRNRYCGSRPLSAALDAAIRTCFSPGRQPGM